MDIKLSDCGLFVDEKLPYIEFCCGHVVKRLVWE